MVKYDSLEAVMNVFMNLILMSVEAPVPAPIVSEQDVPAQSAVQDILSKISAQTDTLIINTSNKGIFTLDFIIIVAAFVLLFALLVFFFFLWKRKHEDLEEKLERIYLKHGRSRQEVPALDNKLLKEIKNQLDILPQKLEALEPPIQEYSNQMEKSFALLQLEIKEIYNTLDILTVPDLGPMFQKIDELEHGLQRILNNLNQQSQQAKIAAPPPETPKLQTSPPKPAEDSISAVQQKLMQAFKQWKTKDSTDNYFHQELPCSEGKMVAVAPMLNAVPFDRMEASLKNRFDRDDYFEVGTEYGEISGIVKQVHTPAIVLIEPNNLPRRISRGRYTKYMRR